MIVLSAAYPICQTVMLRFSQGMRLACNNKVYTPEEEYPLIWALVGLGCGQRENDDGVLENGEYDTPDLLPFSCASSQLAGRYATKRGFPEPTYCNPPCPEDPTSYCPSNCESYFLEWPCNSMAPGGVSPGRTRLTERTRESLRLGAERRLQQQHADDHLPLCHRARRRHHLQPQQTARPAQPRHTC